MKVQLDDYNRIPCGAAFYYSYRRSDVEVCLEPLIGGNWYTAIYRNKRLLVSKNRSNNLSDAIEWGDYLLHLELGL